MKTQIKFLTFLVSLFIFSCQKDAMSPPCKLSTIDRGNGNKHTYTYDGNGRIATMTRDLDGSGAGNTSKYVYTFSYDAAGLLIKSVWTLEGKPNGSESYTYTNGKISKVSYSYEDGRTGTNNVTYDAKGRMTIFTIETGNPENDIKLYYEYDMNGIVVKQGVADLQGNKFYEVITKPVGIAKSPDFLLIKSGLPYDVLTGGVWNEALGNVGTTTEIFYADETGKLVADNSKEKTTDVKVNAQGYIYEFTVEVDGKAQTQKFTLADCN